MAFLKQIKLFLYSTNYLRFKPTIKYNKLFSSGAFLSSNENITYSNVKTFKHQHITLISLNRPDDKNTLNVATVDDLRKAISNFEDDPSSTIGVLYGEGGSFCAGYDPGELSEAPQVYDDFLKSHCQKPIIAAVSGFAYNVGFDLCLWCDLRIVEENAVMAIDRKLNTSNSKIFLKRLLKTVGYSRTMDLLLTGRDIKSKEAFECGLANRVVACGSSVGQAVNMAFNVGKFPQESMNYDRSVIHELTSE
ncbi:probable enoyl-CoA hydratase, mitochondrial isoform X1 [Metopolophium dirhodum]|uniref:probable enoyl-CoA hydratase, mitochondrial isoform X1 n=1 Tax=Metopolophium dirhodum TaxID=44670 RepID=UPI00298FF72C|nr:probable enoyl-CoA hydratase, mitochondrial isoform X1 [Metopolophium dirhodum]